MSRLLDWLYTNVIAAFFGAVEVAVDRISSVLRSIGRFLRDRIFHHVAFWLVLGITALRVLIGTACSELDRLLATVERWFIAIAMLVMTALSFLDYLRREIPGFEFEVQDKIDRIRHGTIEAGTGKPLPKPGERSANARTETAELFAWLDAHAPHAHQPTGGSGLESMR